VEPGDSVVPRDRPGCFERAGGSAPFFARVARRFRRSRYASTLKPLSVEEPIDVVWHRLAGYAIARVSFPTPISADALTVIAIAIGLGSAAAIATDRPGHMLVAGGLLTLSAFFDCADGQLARMRKSSSSFGRMLDGVSDSVVMAATFLASLVHLARGGASPLILGLALLAAPTSSFHFGWYDHYKNVFLRFTEERFREGEDLDQALERRRREGARARSLIMRFVWWTYLRYLEGQAWLLRWSDPWTTARVDRLPAHDPVRAEIYARHALGPMRVWRSLFGLGTHVFGFSLACVFDRIDLYVIFRVVILNAVAAIVLLPWQRRASRAAFAALGLGRTSSS
jgi:hypothetical protein